MKNYFKLVAVVIVVVTLMLLTSCGKDSSPIVVEPYVGVTEIIPQLQPQGSTFLVGDTKDIVVRVRNIGDAYSVGSIKLYVSGYSAFSINFNPNALTANALSGAVSVDNTNCASFKGQDFMYIETPISILPGEEIKISFTVTAKVANQLNELYVLLQNRSGGDIDSENNEIFKTLSIS